MSDGNNDSGKENQRGLRDSDPTNSIRLLFLNRLGLLGLTIEYNHVKFDFPCPGTRPHQKKGRLIHFNVVPDRYSGKGILSFPRLAVPQAFGIGICDPWHNFFGFLRPFSILLL
jgi:hypothetical protein